MARETLLTGTAGGIIGAIAGGIGIIWSIVDTRNVIEIVNALYDSFLNYLYVWNLPLGLVYGQILTPFAPLFFDFSLILAILLIVSSVLTGIGFYGVYQAGGGAMGVVGLAFGIIGGAAGSIFLILGNIIPGNYNIFNNGYVHNAFIISIPSYLLIFIGFAILGVSLILMGSASIVLREATAHSSAAAAAGILSIVGGCFMFPYILDWLFLSIAGGIFTLIAFVLLLAAFIIWAVVFYSSRNV